MDFFELLQKRRACHHFDENFKLPQEDFLEMIEHAKMTPSGYNAQPWEFVLIQDPENLKKISKIAFGQKHVEEAGSAIVVLGDSFIGRNADEILDDWVKLGYCTEEKRATYKQTFTKKRSAEKYHNMALRNASLVAVTLLYVIENMGYSSCPMMGFSQLEMKRFLKYPDTHFPILLIAVGKGLPEKENPQLPRKKVENMIWSETYGKKF